MRLPLLTSIFLFLKKSNNQILAECVKKTQKPLNNDSEFIENRDLNLFFNELFDNMGNEENDTLKQNQKEEEKEDLMAQRLNNGAGARLDFDISSIKEEQSFKNNNEEFINLIQDALQNIEQREAIIDKEEDNERQEINEIKGQIKNDDSRILNDARSLIEDENLFSLGWGFWLGSAIILTGIGLIYYFRYDIPIINRFFNRNIYNLNQIPQPQIPQPQIPQPQIPQPQIPHEPNELRTNSFFNRMLGPYLNFREYSPFWIFTWGLNSFFYFLFRRRKK